MFNKKIKLLLLFLLLLFFLGANFIYAAEINYPKLPGIAPLSEKSTIADYFNYIFVLMIWLGLILAGAVFIYSAFLYVTSFNNPERISSARGYFKSAILGLLILFTSFLILKTINPQLVIFETPKLQQTPITEKRDIPPPPLKKLRTLINVEIPFGQIIEEKIFEATPQPGKEPRKDRIESIANNSLTIVSTIETQSKEIKELTEQCDCYLTAPVIINGEKTCSSNPCLDVTEKIQELEEENLKLMGIEIKGFDDKGNPTITPPHNPNLISEQEKAIEEIRLLKEEIGKIERAEKLMLKCPLQPLESLSNFLFSKDWYRANDWQLINVKFWQKMPVNINSDYASFFCPVSGTILGEITEIPIEEILKGLEGLDDILESPDVLEKMYCREVPVGKIIDRTKRLGYKLVERLEKLNNLSRQMINAVDQFHALVSQCSSKRCVNQEIVCEGIPCPKAEIADQIQTIKDIVNGIPEEINPVNPKREEGIKDVVIAPISGILKANLSEEKKEQVGIISLFRETIPGLINDLENEVRKEMKSCVSDIPIETMETEPEQAMKILIDCESALRSSTEEKTIQKCLNQGEDLFTENFRKCLSQCYLEKNQTIYNKCIETCLVKKTNKKLDEVKTWKHQVDFFCCGK